MERKGKRTHQGEINRDIKERNKIGGIHRQIRKQYYLSADSKSFEAALEKNNMMIARVTEEEASLSVAHFAVDDRYASQYRGKEYVALAENGSVYRLSGRLMGDSSRNVDAFLKAPDGNEYPGLEAARAEMKRRSLIPKVNRDELIEKLMGDSVVQQVAIADLPKRGQEQYDYEDRLFGTVPKTFVQPKDYPRASLPYGAKMPQVGGNAAKIWWAYNSNKTPEEFQKSLEGRDLHLARVTAEDAQDSHSQHWSAKQFGRYHPILREGEYLVLSDRGQIYRLNERSLGHQDREVRAFLGRLDEKPLPSLREAQNAIREKHQKELLDSLSVSRHLPGDLGPLSHVPLRKAGRTAAKIAGPAFQFVANVFEALLARSVSPEERKLAKALEEDSARRARRRRREQERGR